VVVPFYLAQSVLSISLVEIRNTKMQFIQKSSLTKLQKQAIRGLWNSEYPAVISQKTDANFDAYLKPLGDQHHVLVWSESGELQAWFFDFVRNNERNFAMIVSRKAQGKGLGKKLLLDAQDRLPELKGWVVKTQGLYKADGTEYVNPKDFYSKCGFVVIQDEIWKTKAFETVKIAWFKTAKSHLNESHS
jgi:GNAT superfamily N-acetyltransferase